MSKLTANKALIPFLFISILAANNLHAQSVTADTSAFKPGGRLWGLVFADYYYKSHADSLGRGSYQYSKVPKNTNAFQYRRIYLGYTYDISPKFTAEILLAAENDYATATTPLSGVSNGSAGDLLQDNNFAPYIKFANVRWKNIWKGTDLVAGQQATPLAAQIAEPAWGYRNIERTAADFNKSNTFDMGASLQGKFDPSTGNFGYNAMIGNGTKAVPENDNYKYFYGDVWGKFLDKKLWVDLYADYNKLGYTSGGIAYPHSRNMFKATVAYVTVPFTIGAEGFINNDKNDVVGVNSITKDTSVVDATGTDISIYVHGQIIKDKLGFFARYDNFNPDTKYGDNGITSYITKTYNADGSTNPVSPLYDVTTKTQFVTVGLDFTPAKNVHLEPNIWYLRYAGQAPNLVGSASHDYDLVWRLTFYFVFGNR
jgi:hypothetical protein